MDNSYADNTLARYSKNYESWRSWLVKHEITHADDETAARFLAEKYDDGLAPGSISLIIASINWHHREQGDESPVGETCRRVMRGIRRKGSQRGRGQSDALTFENYERIMRSVGDPIKSRSGFESKDAAVQRAELDRVILTLLFMAAMRRSEVAAVTWADVEYSENDLAFVEVRKSKANQFAERGDIRVVKGIGVDALKALRTRREKEAPTERIVPLIGKTINGRFQRMCKNAGLHGKYTSHSGRIGLASELSARGAPITAIAKAGGWKSADIVIHYANKTRKEEGAVVQYL